MNNENGITIVALIITVIIMIILAGVSISQMTNEDGIIAQAGNIANKYNEAANHQVTYMNDIINEILYEQNNMANIVDPSEPEEPEEPVDPVDPVDPGEGNLDMGEIKNLAKVGALRIGDYINYDAGNWTGEDLVKIQESVGSPTLYKTVNDDVTGNQAASTVGGQFGGFEIGDSRNGNAISASTSYTPRTEGWRIWDINEETGVITLIHAGCPEGYYHAKGNSETSISILRNRNCTMYENKYAIPGSAHFLTGWEAADWYNSVFGTDYKLESYNEDIGIGGTAGNGTLGERTMHRTTLTKFSTDAPIEVLENHCTFWVASAYSADLLFGVAPDSRFVGEYSNHYYGTRILVSLNSDVKLKLDKENSRGVVKTWSIIEN